MSDGYDVVRDCAECDKRHALIMKQAKRVAELRAKVEELEGRNRAAMEVYAGMEGFNPETAPEAYCLRIIEQMHKALLEGK